MNSGVESPSGEVLSIGPLRLERGRRAATLHGRVLDLSRTEFDVLWVLARAGGSHVSSQEILNSVWNEVSVESGIVAQYIRRLQKKLGTSPAGEKYILNVPRVGYRFVVPAEKPAPAKQQGVALAAKLGFMVALAALLLFLTFQTRIGVVDYAPLTHDGRRKYGPILTDGRRIYFGEWVNDRIVTVSIPVGGEGRPIPLETPVPDTTLAGLAPRTSRALLITSTMKVWVWPMTGGTLRMVGVAESPPAMSPDGSMIAEGRGASLVLAPLDAPDRARIIPVSGTPSSLTWSPDNQRIRFDIGDRRRETFAVWEMRVDTGKVRPLKPFSSVISRADMPGAWSASGRYSFYEFAFGPSDIWAVRERPKFLSWLARPVRLTRDGRTWHASAQSRIDSSIYAIGTDTVEELVRFDRNARAWVPQWGGTSAYQFDYSRDGRWVTYVRLPDHTVWRSTLAGENRRQIRVPAIEALEPRWSPDGTRIALMSRRKSGGWRVLVVPLDGVAPFEAPSDGADQGVPSWSPDGKRMVFGDRRYETAMSIHLWDLTTGSLSEVPQSRGLWTARWSPDGRFIAAKPENSRKLLLYSTRDLAWRELITDARFIDYLAWSGDSQYIYFNGSAAHSRHRVYRVSVASGVIEDIGPETFSVFENWFGVMPDGTPLALRGVTREELYRLDLTLPPY